MSQGGPLSCLCVCVCGRLDFWIRQINQPLYLCVVVELESNSQLASIVVCTFIIGADNTC